MPRCSDILETPVDLFGHGLIDGLTDAVVVTDARLAVIAWNSAMEHLSGVSRAEALGRPAATVLGFLREADPPALLARARAGESLTVEARCLVPGAGQRWLEAR